MSMPFFRTDLSDQALKAWQNAHPELAPAWEGERPEIRLCHDYDKKESPTMTTPEPTTITLEQLRAMLKDLHARMDGIAAELAAMREGLAHAATPPQTIPQGETITFTATKIERTGAKGKHYYRMLGGMYAKHGISVWPEVLKKMGLGEIEFNAEDAYLINPPLDVRAEVGEYQTKSGETKTGPQKITGLA